MKINFVNLRMGLSWWERLQAAIKSLEQILFVVASSAASSPGASRPEGRVYAPEGKPLTLEDEDVAKSFYFKHDNVFTNRCTEVLYFKIEFVEA